MLLVHGRVYVIERCVVHDPAHFEPGKVLLAFDLLGDDAYRVEVRDRALWKNVESGKGAHGQTENASALQEA
eukprot:56264-Eustigmatos_ZCMA.PRE.1